MSWILIVNAIIVGLLLTPLTRSWLRKRRAERDLPKIASDMGLERQGTQIPGQLGRYTGEYRGRRVIVRPDAFGLIRIALKATYPLALSTDKNAALPTTGLKPFDIGDQLLARAFPFRYAASTITSQVAEDQHVHRALTEFYQQWNGVLRSFAFEGDFLAATTSRGVFFHAPPVERLRPLIDAMIDLADGLEQELSAISASHS